MDDVEKALDIMRGKIYESAYERLRELEYRENIRIDETKVINEVLADYLRRLDIEPIVKLILKQGKVEIKNTLEQYRELKRRGTQLYKETMGNIPCHGGCGKTMYYSKTELQKGSGTWICRECNERIYGRNQ